MAYGDWAWFPDSGEDILLDNEIKELGIKLGSYDDRPGRTWTNYMAMIHRPYKVKCAYYKDTWSYPGRTFYCLAWGVESSENVTLEFGTYREVSTNPGWYDRGNTSFQLSTHLDNTVYGTVALPAVNLVEVDLYPGIPIYDTLAECGQAFNDGIWKEKTKYIDDGYTKEGGGGEGSSWGGGGLFDHSSDAIDFSPLPTDYGTATKMFQVYLPTQTQLQDFADFLFSSTFDLDQLKKLFAEPMSYILGLAVLPLTVSPTSISAHNIYIGNVNTSVQAYLCNKQFIEFDCGSLLVKPFWDAYLDYAPYTKMTLFLPFIGYKDLDTDDIVGKTLQIKYQIDIITGACMAQVKVGDSVRYSFVGQCSANIPLSSQDWTQSIQGAISIAGQIGGMASTGAVSASGVSNVASTAVNMVKPNVQRSGGFSGSGAFLGYKTPYLVITRPVQALPEMQAEYKGFPSYINVYLGDCEGYTEIDSWYGDGFNCSRNELAEIDRLLKEGVYL